MTRQLTYCVVGDGGTDRMLLPVLQWSILRVDPTVEVIEPEFVKRKGTVSDFLQEFRRSVQLVFVHRDAESATLEERLTEFEGVELPGVVPVIPVQMSEAWVLIDGQAIARAAGRPNQNVSVPTPSALERLRDPKAHLDDLLRAAAGNPTGRRKKQFERDLVDKRVDVANWINDYTPLLQLPAFRAFYQTLEQAYPYGRTP